jgi:3-oxoacyl-(acyl-carrier-protein) synthase
MVTPLGATALETVEAWRARRCAARSRVFELAGTPLEALEAAVLPAFDPAQRLGGRRMLKYMSEAAVLGCVAAREAAHEADLQARFPPERVGLFAGTGLAAASVAEAAPMIRQSIDAAGQFSCRLFGERGLAATNPLLSFKILANMPPCLVSIHEGIKGPSLVFTPWEDQAAAALLEAWRAVQDGEVDCALAGGADFPSNPATMVFLRQTGMLRDGEYPAAAGAYVVMERSDTAERDGRRIYARVAEMDLAATDDAPADPLAARLGRTFAAAPAIFLALACEGAIKAAELVGVFGHRFTIMVER